ncbi:energy transducer TonB [Pseudomonas putida CSV86]|uniref:Energy transducer TonB n=2 Tax=Pseudomonas TaxID=286 RepID=A0A177SRU9_PSEPU|nr:MULTISPECIES: energy transducer TonB [Pseudomonas]MDG9886130.1 TonB family protein [Pseudomonas sp. GD04058]NNJ18245.1 energy transducer TonB [Pseudomonas bharatica CSV86]OAI93697.1 energy transducer TonB [Pseudomonas putida]
MIETRYKLGRYGGSLLIVLAVHAVAIALTLNWSKPEAIELPPAAMMIAMPPMPEPAPPPPPKVVTPPQPPAPVEEPPLPKLVEAPKPKIAIPKPAKPKAKPQPPKPEQKEEPKQKPVEQEVANAPPSPAPATKPAAAAPSVASNSEAKATWQSDLLNHLAKYKRYPEDARRRGQTGITQLRFVVDSEGRVVSYELVGKSGSASLDRATLEMIRRAQPLPPPPKDILTNGVIDLKAPFVFSLEKGRR